MQFADLNEINLRVAWPDEARDFTPWLSQHLERLSHAIGIPMELEGTEVPVEQFSADVLARDPTDNSLVLIENQLEPTDHNHLGQILTYLAGLEARTIIWIAREFREPHLSAVRWLNTHTQDPFAFFAVQVKVLRIGNDQSSPVSPVFEVLEKPNGWDRKITDTRNEALNELQKFRHDFWQAYAEQYPEDIQLSPHFKDSNVFHNINGLVVSQYLAQRGVGVYLQTDNYRYGNEDRELARIQKLRLEERGIATTGSNSQHPGTTLSTDSRDRSNWPDMREWLHDVLNKFRDVLLTENFAEPYIESHSTEPETHADETEPKFT